MTNSKIGGTGGQAVREVHEGNPMKKKPAGRTDYNVGPEDFIVVWESSDTAEEVETKTGIPKAICQARASGYRKLGIPLKKMKRNFKKGLKTDFLVQLVKEVRSRAEGAPVAAKNDRTDIQKAVDEALKKMSKK